MQRSCMLWFGATQIQLNGSHSYNSVAGGLCPRKLSNTSADQRTCSFISHIKSKLDGLRPTLIQPFFLSISGHNLFWTKRDPVSLFHFIEYKKWIKKKKNGYETLVFWGSCWVPAWIPSCICVWMHNDLDDGGELSQTTASVSWSMINKVYAYSWWATELWRVRAVLFHRFLPTVGRVFR